MNGEKHKEKLPAQNSAEQEYRGTEGDSSDSSDKPEFKGQGMEMLKPGPHLQCFGCIEPPTTSPPGIPLSSS